ALPRLSPRSRSAVLCLPHTGAARAAEEVQSPRSGDRLAQAEPFGLRDRRGTQGARLAVKPNGGARAVACGGVCPLAAAPGRGAPGAAAADGGTGGRRARLRTDGANRICHALRRVVLVPARSGAPRGGKPGGGGETAGLDDDPGRTRLTGGACAQALVDRTQEPRDGVGGRSGFGAVLWLEHDPEEELPLGVLLAPRPHQDDEPVGCLAPRGRQRPLLCWRFVQSRLPLGALLWRGSAGRAPLRVDA